MTLSVVVIVASDTVKVEAGDAHLRRCLEALLHQRGVHPPEIIVPYRQGLSGADRLRTDFPAVRFFQVADLRRSRTGAPGREHHDELRTRGLEAASGDVIALLEDHEYPAPDWAAQVLSAHRTSGYAAIGGAVENAVDRALNWAVYFCDFGRYQNPLSAGPSTVATDVNVSYKRRALEDVAGAWRERFHERVVHEALCARGHHLALSPAIIVHQHRAGLRLADALRERFIWGRSFAAWRAEAWGPGRRRGFAALTPLLPLLLLVRMAVAVIEKRRGRIAFARALPFTALLTAAWSAGELAGYVTARPSGAVSPRLEVQGV